MTAMKRLLAGEAAVLLAVVMLSLSPFAGRVATAAEPKLHGAKGVLRVTGEPGRYHLVDPATPVDFSLVGPGEVTFTLRAVQPASGGAVVASAHVAIDGVEALAVPLPGGHQGHFAGRRDVAPGPPMTRTLRLTEGPRALSITAESGPVAVLFSFELEPAALALTPLVATDQPIATPPPGEAAREPPFKLPPPSTEPMVPLTIDAPSRHRPLWPYYTMAGALGFAFAGGVLWAVASNTDNAYNSTPSGPNRAGTLSRANNELHAGIVLGGVAFGLLAASAIGLAF